jgi:hypothetical protein
MKIFILFFAFLISGCSMASFYSNGQAVLPPKDKNLVMVFFEGDTIPFEYREIGRVVSASNEDQRQAISRVRRAAAKAGADAVIISRRNWFKNEGKNFGGIGKSEGIEIFDIEGRAICKK